MSHRLIQPLEPRRLLSAGSHYHSRNLPPISLASAHFSSATLTAANLTSANFESASLVSATFSDAQFTSAILTSANFTSANLTAAHLTSVNLTSVRLTSVTLASTNLRPATAGASNFSYAGDTNLDGALNGADRSDLVAGLSTGKSGWEWGDVDYAGGVMTAADFAIFTQAYNYITGLGGPSHPAPGSGIVGDPVTPLSTPPKPNSDAGFLDNTGKTIDPSTIYDDSDAAYAPAIHTAHGYVGPATPRPSEVTLDHGTLKAIGTGYNDNIAISQSPSGLIKVILNTYTTTFDPAKVHALRLLGQAGNDTLTVDLPAALSRKLSIKLQGGTGNDTLTGPTTAATLIAGKGTDTIHSNSLADHVLPGAGRKQIFYADGAQTIGDLNLRPTADGVLTISATSKAAKDFILSQPTQGKLKVTLGNQFTSFSLTNITSINILGRKNLDKISAPTTLANSLPLSQKSIALVG